MTTTYSYRNPFADYNANVLSEERILEYWCSPFSTGRESEKPRGGIASGKGAFVETEMFGDNMPIAFMGGRGTGKTMFLKYFSYPVQKVAALKSAQKKTASTSEAILCHLSTMGGIGFYLRIDGPLLRSFEGKGVHPEHWDAVFTHFLEAEICQAYLTVLLDLQESGIVADTSSVDAYVVSASRLLGCRKSLSTIRNVLGRVHEEIEAVTDFRAKVALSQVRFMRPKIFAAQDLSFGMWDCIRSHIRDVPPNLTFALLVDEYENFSDAQQRIVNTLVKFVRRGLTIRLGMRLEGFHTYETTSKREFLKIDRDYRSVVFEEVLQRNTPYRSFLEEVAAKRLAAVEAFDARQLIRITDFLGAKEDLEREARHLVHGRKNPELHFDMLRPLFQAPTAFRRVVSLIRNADNPLMEMLNVVKVMRGEDPNDVALAMADVVTRATNERSEKYRMDYVDKYKLSLMFLLASVYKDHKRYYSFNTFCFLSSGIVGNFIGLCRRAFEIAYFEARSDLMDRGVIAEDLQDKAARELAFDELQVVQRIHKHGDHLYHLVKNLGNIFWTYHADKYMTYPETNQFALDVAGVQDPTTKEAFRAAVEWSLVQLKPKLQRASSTPSRETIYTLNRVFAPQFDITYRTRGGFSAEEYQTADIRKLMTEVDVPPKAVFRQTRSRPTGDQQVFQFSAEDGEDDRHDSISDDESE